MREKGEGKVIPPLLFIGEKTSTRRRELKRVKGGSRNKGGDRQKREVRDYN